MTQKKKQKGFTLVEVIVVAVIVAVLAAVAVPIYLNYVDNSKVNQANNIAGAVASFCGACAIEDGGCAANAGLEGPSQLQCVTVNAETVLTIPDGYTVVIAAGTSRAFYTSEVALTSATHNW